MKHPHDESFWDVSHTDEGKFLVVNQDGEVWEEYSSRSYAQNVADELNIDFSGPST